MSSSALSDHRKGLLLTAVGGLAISFDMPLIRLAEGNVWSTLTLRGTIMLTATVVVLALLRLFSKARPVLIPGVWGLLTLVFYGLTTVFFLVAIAYAPIANIAFLQTFNPMFGALLSWFFLKERPSGATLVAMGAMTVGVGLIVGDGMASGHLFGDAMALLTALLIAAAITMTRASGRDMGFVSLISALVPAALGLYHTIPAGLSVNHPVWIFIDGGLVMPIAFWCLATGPRYLSAPEVGMFYMLETVLAPIWVWLIFAEAPTPMTMLGGLILLLALMAHSLWQVRARRNAAA
ncbi:DMT family transporter [Rhizobium sp. BK376]|uniref:DMT family transporter n=1 Tax=Rhizobium sp. BK376 TaxID=2512149 RepID=UPI00104F2727|nr:DMT family transporter [Rhizobium sp. BK376]TCR92956.1 EamA domain-containing membrane protein RarD [Rhizobium sp. BK376]